MPLASNRPLHSLVYVPTWGLQYLYLEGKLAHYSSIRTVKDYFEAKGYRYELRQAANDYNPENMPEELALIPTLGVY